MGACEKCGTDHEGYPPGSLGAEVRCLRAQASALDAADAVSRLDALSQRAGAERDRRISRWLDS